MRVVGRYMSNYLSLMVRYIPSLSLCLSLSLVRSLFVGVSLKGTRQINDPGFLFKFNDGARSKTRQRKTDEGRGRVNRHVESDNKGQRKTLEGKILEKTENK